MANRQVSPQQMLDEWDKIIDNAIGGGKGAADAMAAYMVWYVKEIKLRQTLHPPGAYNIAKGGEPPAYASGTLARAMYMRSAHLGLRATALIGNKAPYSRITELGCVVDAASRDWMAWNDSAGNWHHKQLKHPPHPFIGPATEDAIADGSLQEAAIEGFRPYDP